MDSMNGDSGLIGGLLITLYSGLFGYLSAGELSGIRFTVLLLLLLEYGSPLGLSYRRGLRKLGRNTL